MSKWPENHLSRIAPSDDPHTAPFGEDGGACGTPTWIWSVAMDGDSYVRGPTTGGTPAGTGPPSARRPSGSRRWG